MQIEYSIPVTRSQGPCTIIGVGSLMESARENALRAYNSMRAHDGQPPLSELPRGTTSKRLEDSAKEVSGER